MSLSSQLTVSFLREELTQILPHKLMQGGSPLIPNVRYVGDYELHTERLLEAIDDLSKREEPKGFQLRTIHRDIQKLKKSTPQFVEVLKVAKDFFSKKLAKGKIIYVMKSCFKRGKPLHRRYFVYIERGFNVIVSMSFISKLKFLELGRGGYGAITTGASDGVNSHGLPHLRDRVVLKTGLRKESERSFLIENYSLYRIHLLNERSLAVEPLKLAFLPAIQSTRGFSNSLLISKRYQIDLLELFWESNDVNQSEIADVFLPLFKTLFVLHRNRFIHGDISPENIAYFENDDIQLKFSDFGFFDEVPRTGATGYKPNATSHGPYFPKLLWADAREALFLKDFDRYFSYKVKQDVLALCFSLLYVFSPTEPFVKSVTEFSEAEEDLATFGSLLQQVCYPSFEKITEKFQYLIMDMLTACSHNASEITEEQKKGWLQELSEVARQS